MSRSRTAPKLWESARVIRPFSTKVISTERREVDDEALFFRGDLLPDGEGDQPRLLVAVDHLDPDAGGALEAAEQEGRRWTPPGGAGGDGRTV